jgi:hypothetical protein
MLLLEVSQPARCLDTPTNLTFHALCEYRPPHAIIYKCNRDLTQIADLCIDDFEVSIFMTDHSSRHSVLTKQKIFADKPHIQSNSSKLTSWLTTGTSDNPETINEGSTEPIVLQEEDENEINLLDVPEAMPSSSTVNARRDVDGIISATSDPGCSLIESDRQGSTQETDREDDRRDDKKKLSLNTLYDGFSIYGRILCLVVKRKRTHGGGVQPGSSEQMLENWVSTQAAAEHIEDDDENG